mmetsp:Transcript_44937/g.126898  ORF Transcript_44937/g.126898 Transcript_44937/m.126898 type:complete len:99 (-) Transcript_44937:2471-2767(-)
MPLMSPYAHTLTVALTLTVTRTGMHVCVCVSNDHTMTRVPVCASCSSEGMDGCKARGTLPVPGEPGLDPPATPTPLVAYTPPPPPQHVHPFAPHQLNE